jgi:[acyl-carrier-protein] S-malonyltransferase
VDIILLFPGQGSQKPGMARDLASAFPEAKHALEEVDAALGLPLTQVMFEGPAEVLTATHNAQPALLAHGAAVWAVVRDRVQRFVRAAAGHSLGEHTAYHAAGAVGLPEAVRLVRARGELMHDAGVANPGTMAAILGELSRSVDDICAEASAVGRVVPANYNSPEQTVVSGEIAGVERAMALAKTAGAKRVVRLAVAGAFHSPLMAPAAEGLGAAIESSRFSDPRFPVYSNVTAMPVSTASDAKDMLRRQLTSPVRWAELVRNMGATFPAAVYVEMGPGAVLSALVSRLVKGARTVACGTASEVEKLLLTADS